MELTKNISQNTIIKSLFAIILGSIALTISAKIKIPFYPVPMTMQTFVVLFLGISLGYKIGLASVSLYLFEGIMGLPVFSNSPEKGVGLIYFTGPTMGYLVGFLTAVFLASKINNKDSFLLVLSKLLVATSTIYILGLFWLGTLIGWHKPIFTLGAKPFLLAEIFKIIILALITKQIIKIRIPFYPVPMTMQTFVVLFLGLSLGYKIGLASVGLYLLEGIAGLPVFSNSPEKGVGLIYFTGPTMGYLIGFLTASFLASRINSKDNFLIIFSKLTIATSTIYILGLFWLGTLIGWDKPIITLGAKPFLLAEIFKVVLLTLITKQIIKIRNFI